MDSIFRVLNWLFFELGFLSHIDWFYVKFHRWCCWWCWWWQNICNKRRNMCMCADSHRQLKFSFTNDSLYNTLILLKWNFSENFLPHREDSKVERPYCLQPLKVRRSVSSLAICHPCFMDNYSSELVTFLDLPRGITAHDFLLKLISMLSNPLMQKLISIFILLYLSLANSETAFISLHLFLPIIWTFSRGEYQENSQTIFEQIFRLLVSLYRTRRAVDTFLN